MRSCPCMFFFLFIQRLFQEFLQGLVFKFSSDAFQENSQKIQLQTSPRVSSGNLTGILPETPSWIATETLADIYWLHIWITEIILQEFLKNSWWMEFQAIFFHRDLHILAKTFFPKFFLGFSLEILKVLLKIIIATSPDILSGITWRISSKFWISLSRYVWMVPCRSFRIQVEIPKKNPHFLKKLQ